MYCPQKIPSALLPFYESDSDQEHVNPNWGNNWEASSSSNPAPPICFEKIVTDSPVVDNHDLVLSQKSVLQLMEEDQQISDMLDFQPQQSVPSLQLVPCSEAANPEPIQVVMPATTTKRRTRKRLTYVVDDEIQRNTRRHQMLGFEHMEFDEKSKPRKLAKDDTARLKANLELALEEAVNGDQVLPMELMQNWPHSTVKSP